MSVWGELCAPPLGGPGPSLPGSRWGALTEVGELHSLTDWQVSEASEDAELEDFCHAGREAEERREQSWSRRPAAGVPPAPAPPRAAAESTRSTRAHSTALTSLHRPALRMSDRPAADGRGCGPGRGRQGGSRGEQLAGGVGFLRRAGLGKGGVQSSLWHLFS